MADDLPPSIENHSDSNSRDIDVLKGGKWVSVLPVEFYSDPICIDHDLRRRNVSWEWCTKNRLKGLQCAYGILKLCIS